MVEQVTPFLAYHRTTVYQAMNERQELFMATTNEHKELSRTQKGLPRRSTLAMIPTSGASSAQGKS